MGNEIFQLPKQPASSFESPKLSKLEIDMIITNTNASESEITWWYTQFHKMAPDGRMTFDVFDQFYRCCNPGFNTHALAKLIFRHLDRQKNGYVNFYDFFITNSIYRNGNARDRAKLVFCFCDTDNNGTVSAKELCDLLEALHKVENNGMCDKVDMKTKAKEIISRIDLNEDKKLQKSEFIYSMLLDNEVSKLLSFDFAFDVPKEL